MFPKSTGCQQSHLPRWLTCPCQAVPRPLRNSADKHSGMPSPARRWLMCSGGRECLRHERNFPLLPGSASDPTGGLSPARQRFICWCPSCPCLALQTPPCKGCPRHKSRVLWGMVAAGMAGLGCHHPHGALSHHGAGLGPGWGELCAGPDLVPRTGLAAVLVLFARVLGTLVSLARALQALGSALPSRVFWRIGNISETAGLWRALSRAGRWVVTGILNGPANVRSCSSLPLPCGPDPAVPSTRTCTAPCK